METRILPRIKSCTGFSLVELMIAIAVLVTIVSIAIPAYNGYIREARISTARSNMDSLRVFLEDYALDNDTYGSGTMTKAAIQNTYGWTPQGDKGAYNYTLTASASTYAIVVEHTGGTWVRCENRMDKCCDSSTPGANKTACP